MNLFPVIGLIAVFLVLPASDAIAARAKDKLPVGTADPLELPARNATVERVQKALFEAGYYKGVIDGRFNEETDKAIRLYQRREGLPVNGIANKDLAAHAETSVKVQSLLKQLQQQRLSKMKQARKALLARPETRDLISDPKKRGKTSTLGRDFEPCFKDPTPKCLLDEASESAIAIFKSELRDWVMGEILVAKAKAGLVSEAMETVRLIGDPRLIMVALRDIAKAQAAAGRPAEALSAADIIPDPVKRLEALAAIAFIQTSRKDLEGANTTALNLMSGLEEVEDALKRISLAASAVTIFSLSGKTDTAKKELARIHSMAESTMVSDHRSAAMRHVANAYAETGNPEQALDILKELPDVTEHTPVLVSAAAAQVKAGDAEQAITTAESIEAVRYRAVVLSRIARAQAKTGNTTGGRETLEKALKAAGEIERPFAKAYAYERVSLALMELGRLEGESAFAQAIDTAGLISDEKLRAHTLWRLSAGQRKAGDDAGRAKTEEMAETATGEIKSPFTRVWMFCEIALENSSEDRYSQAWSVFNRALGIAKGIESAWGRSRALTRLASTLIELTEVMKK
jgi:tetratricopeptide (TPR) repeat protein